ncbi:hypothetical protein C4K03_0300 [Pseudomonas synxantha]|uniref:Uncharacterized protein n=1 Tax=Pseudomonas synxantha TaxID=47883 RepID=A0A3G7U1D5_9PSED|nr:hypothetical protein C4K03_0300 [Pseudomonas synxantha]PIB51460.1 hypothetical protein AOA57_03665 [Pseudomonas sp. 2588-5]
MWTERDISEAILMGALIFSSPLIYVFTRKLISYLLNRYIPRDAVIDYKENGVVVSSYYIKRRLFKECEYYKLDKDFASQDERH